MFFFFFSSFFITRFSLRVGGQLKIKPPHLAVFHHILHFAWVKSQAIPSKILNVISPSSSEVVSNEVVLLK